MKAYKNYTKFLLIWVFIVIVAGSIVRTTQSGMGCPDWPTCFGNMIPPTQQSQVVFHANQQYRKGQFIIRNDSLKYAAETFTSSQQYNDADWKQYEKHNHASFQVYQTWIEYINRLIGALLGLWILFHVLWSYRKFFKTKPAVFWWSASFLLITLCEAWLGKVVVDTNLAVIKITLHMLLALGLAAIPVVILRQLSDKEKIQNKTLKVLSTIALIFIFIQILFGTEVRQQIDDIAKLLNFQMRELWIAQLNNWFKIHRSFSWVVALVVFAMMLLTKKNDALRSHAIINASLVVVLMALGTAMTLNDIPAVVQPLHLLASSILFISLFAFRLRVK